MRRSDLHDRDARWASSMLILVLCLLLSTPALAQPFQRPNMPNVASSGNQYRGPSDVVPPNGPPPGNCLDYQPAACDLLSVPGADAGCPDPALAVEWSVPIFDFVSWTDPDGWHCITHPEGYYLATVSIQDIFDACDMARNDGLSPPMVDFVVDTFFDVSALYVFPNPGLQEYCVTHLSHQGPDNDGVTQPECNPNYDQPFTKPGNGQWPDNIGNPPGFFHLSVGTTRFGANTTYFGFWDDPGTGELRDYYTWNHFCAIDADSGASPAIDGGRIRFSCDCQEQVINTIIANNQDDQGFAWQSPYDDDIVYWFYANP